MEVDRSSKLEKLSQFNRFKDIAKTEEAKLQEDQNLLNKKTSKLKEELIENTPIKFKELGKSLQDVCAETVNRIQYLQNEIENLKLQDTTLLSTWKQDLSKREQDLATSTSTSTQNVPSGNLQNQPPQSVPMQSTIPSTAISGHDRSEYRHPHHPNPPYDMGRTITTTITQTLIEEVNK